MPHGAQHWAWVLYSVLRGHGMISRACTCIEEDDLSQKRVGKNETGKEGTSPMCARVAIDS